MSIRDAFAVLAAAGALAVLPDGALACTDPPPGLEPREKVMAWTRTANCHARAMGRGETAEAVRAADARNAVRSHRSRAAATVAAGEFSSAIRPRTGVTFHPDSVEAIFAGPHGLSRRLRDEEERGTAREDRQPRLAAKSVGEDLETRPHLYRLGEVPPEVLCAFDPQSHACPNGGRAERWLVAHRAERTLEEGRKGDGMWNRCPSGWSWPDCSGGPPTVEGVPERLRGLVAEAPKQAARALRQADMAAAEAGNNDIYMCQREAVRACLTGARSPVGCPSPCGAP